jgi:hypothetical protein
MAAILTTISLNRGIGADLTIVAHDTEALESTKEKLSRFCKYPDQWVETHSIDLANAVEASN